MARGIGGFGEVKTPKSNTTIGVRQGEAEVSDLEDDTIRSFQVSVNSGSCIGKSAQQDQPYRPTVVKSRGGKAPGESRQKDEIENNSGEGWNAV